MRDMRDGAEHYAYGAARRVASQQSCSLIHVIVRRARAILENEEHFRAFARKNDFYLYRVLSKE